MYRPINSLRFYKNNDDRNWGELLRCSYCLRPLLITQSGFLCDQENHRYELTRQMDSLYTGGYLHGNGYNLIDRWISSTSSNELPKGLIDMLQGVSYNDARDILIKCSEHYQGAWTFFLDISKESTVLIFETSFGGATLAAARRFERVVAICPSIMQARFARQLLIDNDIHNILVLSACDGIYLPFLESSFDAVILHNFSSECQDFFDPRWFKNIIFEVKRLLSVNGLFYISGKYHFIKDIFQGFNNIFSLKRNIQKNPFYRLIDFQFLEDIGKPYLIRSYPTTKTQGVQKLKYLKHCLFSKDKAYIFGLKKEGRPYGKSLYEKIIEKIKDRTGTKILPIDHIQLGSFNNNIIITGEFVVRMPIDKQAEQRCRNNFLTISKLSGFDTIFKAPLPAFQDEIDGQLIFVETRVDGSEINHKKRHGYIYERIIHEAIERFFMIQQGRFYTTCFDEQMFETLIGSEIDYIAPSLSNLLQEDIFRIKEILQRRLIKYQLPLVTTHGDFKYSNLLIRKGAISGLIDWDLSLDKGLPLLDIYLFLAFELEYKSKNIVPKCFYDLTFGESDFTKKIYSYGKLMGLDKDIIAILGFISLIYFINKLSDNFIKYNEEWRSMYVIETISPFLYNLYRMGER